MATESPVNTPADSPRRTFTIAVAFVLCLLAFTLIFQVILGRSNGGIRHVIVISLDTTRADHFGCYGNPWIKTPNLDAIAAESILFEDYMSAISTTLASHTTLFTGRYPQSHGTPRNGFIVNDENRMLPELLKEAGFHTAGFIGSFALNDGFNFAQGFDHYDQQFDIFLDGDKIDQNQRRAKAVTDSVIKYLDQTGVPKRLFLFVHYFDPHQPYDPPAPYDKMYGDGPQAVEMAGHPAFDVGEVSEADRRSLQLYAGEVSYMDHQVGRLLDDLRQRGILDRALLLITSDHGENLGENKGRPFHHGRSVYQSELHSVGMIRLTTPFTKPARLDLPVSAIDMLPTMLNRLRLPIPPEVEGRPIDLGEPNIDANMPPRFGEASKPPKDESGTRWANNHKARCVREGVYKYIRTIYLDREELYDLSVDPHERANLLTAPNSQHLAIADDLCQKLDAWTASQNPLPSHFDRENRDETIERLRALGYLGSDDDEDGSDD